MKKKLIKPPENDGEVWLSPNIKNFISSINKESLVGVCHQPYFFNPGVSLKFLFLHSLPVGSKKIIFLDTDRVNFSVNLPDKTGSLKTVELINDEQVLYNYPNPGREFFRDFFFLIEEQLKQLPRFKSGDIKPHFFAFKNIFFKNQRKKFLKHVLSESFLDFYNIRKDYRFLSDLTLGQDFKNFFLEIYRDSDNFIKIFNEALADYKQEFRFRFKNFPFPRLTAGELPFWIIKDGKRRKCFKSSLDLKQLSKLTIFPRAVSLTIFLRLYKLDFFIHGIGGANYEWIQDRVIERFFKAAPSSYAVISGTFFMEGFTAREAPYFFFSPEKISSYSRIS